MAQYTFSHLINPVSDSENSALFKVQPHTFASIEKAIQYAEKQDIKIQPLACFTKQNTCTLSNVFNVVAPLTRDCSEAVATNKKLPYFNDILQKLYDHSEADYLIYTNLDICLVPNFYTSVKALIAKGHDAIIINRRVIGVHHLEHGNLDLMYADMGRVHTGYDTFIFKKDLFKQFILKDICIGVPPVGNDLFHNIFAFAKNPVLETKMHLTFHIGLDLVKKWGDNALRKHNQTEYKKLLKEIGPHLDIYRFPGANKSFFSRHFKWLMNPTINYPLMYKTDIKHLGKKRKPRRKHEIPGLRQRFYEWLVKKLDLE